jgi:cystathionine beta-lyase/cystathionine gamma-synthase
MSASTKKIYRPETRLVQSGTLRSPFGETSEALYLTQGYVYDSAAQAEARFKGGAWRRSRAPKPRAPPRPAWPRSPFR